ncbi:Uncharacterised protein [Mycobacteroides abscessus subsp. massiliense]|nr:hypothetical protein [Mycobacteroides abscessus]SKH53389.1 Uncharacterised protein [Mycobacteroides abscessus subsp. massiliense]SKH84153.1 Uncharacterised protein [Mycobacteroides abscessus subsp. massiliense]SKK33739.1 Uncharacterised protein [Mycobacteroides abscessus subsp. massiliense]SKK45638.1 Uncharacterised protein [Mycobacteroides abscessus subsp. massiliense]SKL87261.1 Uncharacterised protein [Mycobacteroides abscessus subsp. massiliense]
MTAGITCPGCNRQIGYVPPDEDGIRCPATGKVHELPKDRPRQGA